ncbi:MAG: hypothetical protein NE330_13970, partial [Lentisphaeraceae bacterium]|nr:hypothetical protein [Lentisphaeraceae bacterium]
MKFGIMILVTLLMSVFTVQAETKGTGYVRIEKIDGAWWFINADGKRFVSMGVNHLEPHLWLSPYNKDVTLKRYGADMVDE